MLHPVHLKLMPIINIIIITNEVKISTITLKSQPKFSEWTEMALTPYATCNNKPALTPGIGGGGG